MTDDLTSCTLRVRVRYAESDPMGYLHHSKYFEYFEMGRTELLRRSGQRCVNVRQRRRRDSANGLR